MLHAIVALNAFILVTHVARVYQPCTWSVEQKKNNISLCPRSFAPENLVSRDGFDSPVPRQPAHLHRRAESSSAHLRDSFRVPRRRPFSYKTPTIGHRGSVPSFSCHAIAYTDGVHCRQSNGTVPVNLKVVPNEYCLGRSPWTT